MLSTTRFEAADGAYKNSIDEEDIRSQFLCYEISQLALAVARFAADYARGVYRVNNLKLMNCKDLKCLEAVATTTCDKCKRAFNKIINTKLYCLINNKIEQVDETNCHNRFKIICGKCESKVTHHTTIETHELYPQVSSETLRKLCQVKFITRYIFPIDDMESYTMKKEIFRDQTRDVKKSLQEIASKKLPNEQIVKLIMRTYEKPIFSMTLEEFVIKTDPNGRRYFEFDTSSAKSFIETHKFLNMTYFYEIHSRVYRNENYSYTAYFAKPFAGFGKRLTCHRCKSKFYKKNIILYCSTCGFMNRMHFSVAKDKIDIDNIKFYEECIMAVKTRDYCIIYYDYMMYRRLTIKYNKL